MVAFWERITERGSAEQGPCASRNFPVRASTKYTWCNDLFDLKEEWDESEVSHDMGCSGAEDAVPISEVFVGVTQDAQGGGGGGGMPGYDECFQGF